MPLLVPGQHDVTAAFFAVDIPSSRQNSHIAWDENLRSRVSALFDPEDRPPLAQATESDAAKVAIAVGVVTKSGLAEAEKAIKNGLPRPKWSGMAEGAFHALETGTMWPTGAFWLRISLANGDSSTSLALKRAPCGEIAPQVESKARIFPEFVLTKLLEYCDEKSILALADTCKTSYFFMNSRWKQVMKSSYLVTHFMKPRANMRVQLPPPGFTPRQFLQMLASEACAECASKDLDSYCAKERCVPICRACMQDHSVHVVANSLRLDRVSVTCPESMLWCAPGGFGGMHWWRDVRWLARDCSDVIAYQKAKLERLAARSKKRARAVRNAAEDLEVEPDWLKEHSVFTDVAIGRLRIGKDRDRILSTVREAMACEKELDDLEHEVHPLTFEAIDRRKLLLVDQSVTPRMVTKVLKRINEALKMVKMPDVAVLNRLRCLTFSSLTHFAVKDWALFFLPTPKARVAWMKADCSTLDPKRMMFYLKWRPDWRRDYNAIVRSKWKDDKSFLRIPCWDTRRRKFMALAKRERLIRRYYDSLRPEGVDFDEIIMEGDVEKYVRFGKVVDGRPMTFWSKNSDDVHNLPRDIFDLHVERLRSQKQQKRALKGHAKDHVETTPKGARDNFKRRRCNDKGIQGLD